MKTKKLKAKDYVYPENYAFTSKEIEVDNKIFEITDKGTREDKVRLLKILKNRSKIIEGDLKR